MTPNPRTTALRDRPLSRRCALLGMGGVGAAAVLTACSSGSSGSSDAGAATAAPASSSAATTPAPGSSAAATSPSAAGSAPAGGAAIAKVSDIPVGGSATVEVDGQNVLLSQPTAGKVEAFSAVCPHQGGQVKPDGAQFLCSLHKSEFALDGKVTRGPAQKDLTAVPVTVSGSDVVKG